MSINILRQLKHTYLALGSLNSVILKKQLDGTTCLNRATTGLGIATIVLGVKNADLYSQLEGKSTNRPITTTPRTTVVSSTPPTTPQTPPTTTQTPPTTSQTPPTTSQTPPIDMSKYRLPSDAMPVRYDLYLFPDLETGLFRGEVSIDVDMKETTKELVLHSHLLDISRVTIFEKEADFEIDKTYELLTVRNKDGSDFKAGSVSFITIEFNGDMKNRIVGLYASSYSDPDGDQRYMATSKFEPTYARQAYPCFDEPNFKATFKVHLLRPNDPKYIALSNHPQIAEKAVDGGLMVDFEETVPMSTYLTCFIVSDFKSTDTVFKDKKNGTQPVEKPFRVFASPHQLNKTTYAGEVGQKVIEYYIDYFDIGYPLPKLDMVAISDFVSGAMEHWGLVTFRETALLYENSTHSESNKARVAQVVAHELAHSWFGNLVTMDWWNNLWLNEGFATYIAVKGVDHCEPDWKALDEFLISTLHPILSLDATQGSHPIIQEVVTPDQITEVFDMISYDKGASILRMLESVVTPEKFKLGIKNYLTHHQYANAVTQDLWDELQNVLGPSLNITEFMDTFTVQMGYPILQVRTEGDKYILTQKRFLKDYSTADTQKSSPLNYKWSVPVTYVTDQAQSTDIFWFNYKESELTIPKPSGVKWLKFNPDQIGYYRVNYQESDWLNLIQNIQQMSATDRTHLIEESFSIAESGELSYAVPLTLTKYLVNETEYIAWSAASSQLQQIAKYLTSSQFDSDFKKYVVDLLLPIYDKLTWNEADDDSHLTKLTRSVVLNLACVLNYDDALIEAKKRFDAWIEDPEKAISPDLRALVYKYGMVNADEHTWDVVFEMFANENDANEKLKLMNGLANVRNPTLLTKLIESAKDETYVRSQDYFSLLSAISDNPVGTPIVWDYVRENWVFLVERFTLNNRYLGRLIPSITKKFLTNIKVDEMLLFFEKHPEAGAGAAARKQALETVQNNIKWLGKYRTVVEDWITNNTKPDK